jgi:hypothetical protein
MTITPGGCGKITWELPRAPANGWDEITFPLTVHTAPDAAGWFFAQQFAFVGGNLGYCGIRPRPGGANLAAFSVFGEGSTVVDGDRCRPGADGGSGASCSAWAPLIRGREYLFTVYRDHPGSRVWRGTLTDATTLQEWDLGAWSLSHDGGIKPSHVGFMEYYKAVAACEATPLATLHFGAPYSAPSGTVGRCHSPTHYGRCNGRTNFASETKPDGRVWMRNGWPTRGGTGEDRRMPEINVEVNINVHNAGGAIPTMASAADSMSGKRNHPCG